MRKLVIGAIAAIVLLAGGIAAYNYIFIRCCAPPVPCCAPPPLEAPKGSP
jgi:hypothetical protein